MRKLILILLLLCSADMMAWAQGSHSVVLTWGASPTSGVTYNMYRKTSAGSCVPANKIVSGLTALTYTDTTVLNGATYFYAVSAQSSGGESTCSAEVQIAIPTPPQPPSNLSAIVQ